MVFCECALCGTKYYKNCALKYYCFIYSLNSYTEKNVGCIFIYIFPCIVNVSSFLSVLIKSFTQINRLVVYRIPVLDVSGSNHDWQPLNTLGFPSLSTHAAVFHLT